MGTTPGNESARSAALGSGPIDVVAIAGTGQNGATLCCRMLGEFPGYFAVGEIGRLWDKGLVENVACACGEPFRSCPFWAEVGERAYGGWDALDQDEMLRLYERYTLKRSRLQHPFALPFILFPSLWPSFGRDLRAYQRLMERLYRGILEVSGAQVIVDSMKIPAHIYLLATQERFHARFVQLVRDPRGVAFSNTKEVPRQGSRADKPMRTTRTPRKTATKWLWFNLSFDLLKALRHPFERLRYESFVRDPEAALRLCAQQVGRTLAPEDLTFLIGRTATLPAGHLVAGNRMRHLTGEIELRSDEAWRLGLPERDRRTVERVTTPLMRRYGYTRGEAVPDIEA
jgi:hypothetical protein